MTPNLLELAEAYLTSDAISKISKLVRETPDNTRRALKAIVPSLTAAACHGASTPEGASALMKLVSGANLTSVLSNFGSVFDGGPATDGLTKTGSNIVSGLLGVKASGVANLIAETTGVRVSSASSLMSLAAPVLFGGLLKHFSTSGLTTAGLPEFLSGHRDEVLHAIPAGLGGVLGVSRNESICGAPAPVAHPAVVQQAKRSSVALWLLPLAALAIGFIVWKTQHRPIIASINLPCGTTLLVEQGSFAYNLATFMLHGSATDVPKRFVFDHLNFESSTTQLTTDSNGTVTQLVRVMACYPNMTVELDGHTDSTGDAEANRALSLDRANAVRDLLVQGGIDASRITTAGFGQDRPIASNDTEEGRAKNRRTELVVLRLA